ncbi:MAG TPA: hypothetical protein VF234_01215, partial [Limnochordia bacterium]
VALLLFDLSRGAPWMQRSVLGYDPMGGARYYGIGNEFMGVLIGSTIVAASLALDRFGHRPLTWLCLACVGGAVGVALGLPTSGANVGGAITACIGFGLTALWLRDRPLTVARAGALLLATGIAVIGAALWDLFFRPADPSHLGRLARTMVEGGLAPLLEVAGRKLAMNWTLLRYTIWTRVLLVSAAAMFVLLTRPHPFLERVFAAAPALRRGLKGAIAASFVALLVNDSGVVAAATALIPATVVVLDAAARPAPPEALAARRQSAG